MMHEKNNSKLRRKLASLEKRVALIESLADFLRKYPSLASGTTLRDTYGGVTLDLGRATIRPIWKQRVKLRLEWDREEFQEEATLEERTICDDLLGLSEQEVLNLLATIDSEEEESDED